MEEYLNEVIEKVKEILAQDVGIKGDEPLCAELGMTSMQIAQLAYELEEVFGIEIPDTIFQSDMTALDFAGVVKKEIEGE